MRIVAKRPGELPEIIENAASLLDLQKLIGGYIEVAGFIEYNPPRGVLMLVDEEGKRKGLPWNIRLRREVLVGLVVAIAAEGEEFCELTKEEAERAVAFLSSKAI